MVIIRETTANDLVDIQQLWADGDVMKYVGFPEGLHKTSEDMRRWFDRIVSARPATNHFSVFEDDSYCGEAFFAIDQQHGNSAALDIKLFRFARGRGIASAALSYAAEEAFKNGAETVWVDPNPNNTKAITLYERLGFERKPMPAYLIGEEGVTSIYMELTRSIPT